MKKTGNAANISCVRQISKAPAPFGTDGRALLFYHPLSQIYGKSQPIGCMPAKNGYAQVFDHYEAIILYCLVFLYAGGCYRVFPKAHHP